MWSVSESVGVCRYMNLHMYILGMCTFVCVCMYMEWVSNNQSIDRSIDQERERERERE